MEVGVAVGLFEAGGFKLTREEPFSESGGFFSEEFGGRGFAGEDIFLKVDIWVGKLFFEDTKESS